MTITLALERLFDSVQASFAADSINAVNVFGWREPSKHPAGVLSTRIAWVPGDPSDSVGSTGPARNPGQIPRSLGTLGELFTVYISGQDPSAPEDERKQYHICRLLRDAWFRAVYAAAYGTFAVRSETWVNNQRERRHGAALRLVCEIQAPIIDAPPDDPLITGGDGSLDVVDAVAAALPDQLSADIEVLLVDSIESPASPITPPDVGGGDGEGGLVGKDVQSLSNKNMPALVTVADGALACAIAILKAPSFDAFVNVAVNGLLVTNVGDGTRVGADVYFSHDGGTTARAWNAIAAGDTIHWNGSVAGYELTTNDRIDVWYEERGE